MRPKVNPMLNTNSDSDSLSDFVGFRVNERKVDSVKEIVLEIEFWNGGRLGGTLSLSTLAKLKSQINKILKGKHYAQIQKGQYPESYKEEDFIEDLENAVNSQQARINSQRP